MSFWAVSDLTDDDLGAVYHLQFSDKGALTRGHVYYEDIAGIEGARWYVVAVLVFVAGAVLSTATLAFLSIGRFVARGVARFAAGMRASHD
jgi:hypothetical protein